jgi:hypothetical protein
MKRQSATLTGILSLGTLPAIEFHKFIAALSLGKIDSTGCDMGGKDDKWLATGGYE